MKLGIVMPVVLQNAAMLAATVEAAAALQSTAEQTLFLVCNRLSVCGPAELGETIRCVFPGKVQIVYEPLVERSVAGAWNEGCRLALADGNDLLAVIANDTRVEPECLDRLASHITKGTADLCSGISTNNRATIDEDLETDGADFSCFMISPLALKRFGPFDPSFRPAYFEDNDYYARVVLGGGACRVIHAARFFHHGSLTVKADAEMAHHVRYWFEKNRAYFSRKWGVQTPEATAAGVIAKYFQHPFNDATKPISWSPEEAS